MSFLFFRWTLLSLKKDLIESNKEIEFVDESKTQIVKNLKLNFKTLGKKCGKHMKAVQAFANEHQHGQLRLNIDCCCTTCCLC